MTSASYLYMGVCACLFYTCFCRLVRTSRDTEVGVRTAFILLASAALVSLGLVFYGHYQPTLSDVILPAAMLLVQAITARYWRDGVPPHFQKCVCPVGQIKE